MWAGLHGAEGSMAGDDCAFACADARALACAGEEAGAVWGFSRLALQSFRSVAPDADQVSWLSEPLAAPPRRPLALLRAALPPPRRLGEANILHGPPTPPHGAAPRPGSRAPEALVVLLPLSERHSFARCVPSLHEPLQWRRAHRGTRLAMRSPALARRGGGATCMS
ncbi:unnamed protein product [Prorocentrum cordatum]|uniref:Uncharacterized protein n=1 Tax=Prorocentrum cordatum TaxID=2364126 RepID=A0ABN9SBD1_9DINO|nr:unnamed protein product [Polarella glacialis]